MSMQTKLILIFSLVFSLLGFATPVESFVLAGGNNGELFNPVSSGGEDPFTIKLALASYILCFAYTATSLVLGKGLRFILGVYAINSIFYMFCIVLVSLDSSIWGALENGNWLPLLQVILWLISVVAVSWVTFNKGSHPTHTA